MRYILTITVITFLFFSCKKNGGMCVKKGDLYIDTIDEDNMTYHEFKHDNYKIFVPEYFTPNGDNLNDELLPIFDSLAIINIEKYEIIIKSKCGLLFNSNSIDSGWSGKKSNGKIRNKGKYKVILDITWSDKSSFVYECESELVK